ncbi:MAG: apolipoprotein A1/A4/E family protein [Paramuribaculum sp.]|nr:apolipoprotein A1/A4/E family protein [Paramuribaculum sp.]
MSSFDLYIHGTPRGHQIWGSENNHDYINKFYNQDKQAHEKAVMYAEICNGDSYYTYIRHQNLYDTEGRPEAFFALTVCFRKSYCSNVYKLYNLLEQVYTKLCLGTIISQKGDKETYIVPDLTLAHTGGNTTVKIIQSAINQNITESISQFVYQLTCGDTFDRPSRVISLLEVDSPLFVDYFKKYSLIISPTVQTSSKAYETVANNLREVTSQKEALISKNSRLETEVTELTKEKQALSNELQTSISASKKKYQNKIEELTQDLSEITKERDSLKGKLSDASKYSEQINKPVQQLTRLLAGRFPDSCEKNVDISVKEAKKCSQKHNKKLRKEWINSILLLLVLIVSTAVLVIILVNKPKAEHNVTAIVNPPEHLDNPTSTPEVVSSEIGPDDGENYLSEKFTVPDEVKYDSWSECYPNIIGGSDNLNINKDYKLKITKAGTKANVPERTWKVETKSGNQINEGDSFRITDPALKGTKITISYIVNGETKIIRKCTVK